MKIVATMIVRDEADVISETIEAMAQHTKNIVVLDGGSDDGTYEILQGYDYVDLHQHHSGTNWDHAGERQMLLNLARDHSADWVITFDCDEIYHSDPIKAIQVAEQQEATVITCEIPQFVFTEKELLDGVLQNEDESLPVQERRRWYAAGWRDSMIWKMQDGLTYLGNKPGRITRPPHFTKGAVKKDSTAMPVLKHYQYRSLMQYAKKMKTRRRNCGGKNARRWFGPTYENPFKNEAESGYHYYDGGVFYGHRNRPIDDNIWLNLLNQ